MARWGLERRFASEDNLRHTGAMTNTDIQATFVLVDAKAPTAYWDDYATGCGSGGTESGWHYRVVATRRIGAQGRADARYIIDRMASGMWHAELERGRIRPMANEYIPFGLALHTTGPTPAEVHDVTPEARGLVALDEEPESLLWPEDTDEDGEVITVAADRMP